MTDDAARLARFDRVASRMPAVADAVAAFDDDALREKAFYALLTILDPDGELDAANEPADDDLRDARRDVQVLSGKLVRLTEFLADRYPGAYRPDENAVDSAIRLLTERWGGPSVTALAAEGRLAVLTEWMATHIPARALRGGEDAVDCAIRLLNEWRQAPVADPDAAKAVREGWIMPSWQDTEAVGSEPGGWRSVSQSASAAAKAGLEGWAGRRGGIRFPAAGDVPPAAATGPVPAGLSAVPSDLGGA